ncbi:MAG: alpha/beta fold hydrolase [Bacteroidetes bacterium]|nr:alpha/beta fold hydrolase [Bacteroidota bacterium]
MNFTAGTTLIFLFMPLVLFGQRLKIEPYEFISKANDTVAAELGSFQVLEDRTKGTSDSIKLSFVRFKSTNPAPGSPIVYLSGGPGGSGTGTAKGKRFELFMKLREVADVIAFDQRGTGLSHRLPACPYSSNFELEKALDKEDYVNKTTAMISECLTFWEKENINIEAYNTTESAVDINELRKILDVDKISIWGISYGSHLAFEYIRLFENNIDKMVLASLEGPNETIKLPKNTEDFVFQIAELADGNYGSAKTYPQLKEKIIKVHQRLQKEPVTSSYKNRRGGRDTVGISNFELQSAIATFYLKNPDDSKELPKIYSQLYKGDYTEIAPDVMVMKRYIFPRINPMSFAMDMQSGISMVRKEIVAEQINQSILGSTINFLMYEWIMELDFPQLPNDFREMEPNTVNALLLSGTMDGRTYLNSAKEIAKKFKNGKHLILENAGHDLYMQSPLVGDAVLNFFKGEKLNLERMVLKPITFE